jgi:2-haloalkanoic acid dehalogenase type II
MPIQALVFDLDDTLWPLVPLIHNAENQVHTWLEQHAPKVTQAFSVQDLKEKRMALIPSDPRFSYDLWALRHTALKHVLAEVGEHTDKADQAIQVFFHARNQVQFFPEVKEVLTILQKNYTLASISNGFADLHSIGIAPFFKASLAAHSFGCAKPDPRIFLAMAEQLEMEPANILYIGDDLRLDVQGAQEAGMQAAWMNRQQINLEESKHPHVKPDFIVKDLHELLSKL